MLNLTPNSRDRIVGERQSEAPLALGYHVDNGGSLVGSSGGSNANLHENQVFGFLLPTGVESINSATLVINKGIAGTSAPGNDRGGTSLDLWGLATSNPDFSGTSLFLESNSDPNPLNIKLADNFITQSMATNAVTTTDVKSWIEGFYPDENPSQDEVFFRLNQHTPVTLPSLVRSSINPSSVMLILDYEPFVPAIVPEPSSLILWGSLGSIGAIFMWRKRRSAGC